MRKKKRDQGNFDHSEQNGNPPAPEELTLPEEATFLIHLIFEEGGFEDLLMNYPHHAAYCFASITRLAETTADVSHFARRLGMWLWFEVFSFQIEEPLSLKELAEHFDTDVKTIQNAIDELVKIRDFDVEWQERDDIKLIPRMSKETVLNFAEQVLSGIEAGEQEEGGVS